MLLHLCDEQLESGAQAEIKPPLLLLSSWETCFLLSRECERSAPPFWLRRLSCVEIHVVLFSQRTFHSPSRACVPLWLEQNVKMFIPIQRLSDRLIWFVSEPQWSTVYLFTKGQRTHYLHRGLLFMWHIMLMTYFAKDTDYFSVFSTM